MHVHANPDIPETTGKRWFFVDEGGLIRFSTTATATAASPVLSGDGSESPGIVDERESEHTITGCGAAQGSHVQPLIVTFTRLALDGVGRLLPQGTSSADAQVLLNDPQFLGSVIAHLDANDDKNLTLREVVGADLLLAARDVKAELFVGDPRDKTVLGKDHRLETWTTWYQAKLAALLDLGIDDQ